MNEPLVMNSCVIVDRVRKKWSRRHLTAPRESDREWAETTDATKEVRELISIMAEVGVVSGRSEMTGTKQEQRAFLIFEL